MFRVSNRHGAASDAPPAIEGDVPGRYYNYFENEYGKQTVVVYDYDSQQGMLWMRNIGWDHLGAVDEGIGQDLVLNETEQL